MGRVLKQRWIKALVLLVCLFSMAQNIFATTVRVPADADMIIGARAIVRGKVLSVGSAIDERDNRIYTYITLRVNEVLKGQIITRRIVLKELGGVVGDRITVVYGSPRFTRGEKVLLYLDTRNDGTLKTHEMFLGKFNITIDPGTGQEVAVRSTPDENTTVLEPHSHGDRGRGDSTERLELSAYTQMVNQKLSETLEESRTFEETFYRGIPTLAQPAEFSKAQSEDAIQPQFTLLSPTARWRESDTGQPIPYTLNNTTQEGVPPLTVNPADIAAAAGSWSNVSGSALRITSGGNLSQCYSGGTQTGIHVVSNNCDGQNTPSAGCASVLAWGGWSGGSISPQVVNGVSFQFRITQGFVSCNPWAACSFGDSCSVRFIVTHEMGHALGFGHSQFQQATMNAFAVAIARCAVLHVDDEDAARAVYPVTGGGGGPLSITTASPLSNGTVGTVYSQALSATGGTTPYTWSLVTVAGQSLPPGLTLGTNGIISGNPTTAGAYNFTVQVRDSAATPATVQKAFAITVSAPGLPYNSQFLSQTVPASLTPGQVFSVSMQWQNTGTQTWSGPNFYFVTQNPAFNTTWGGAGGFNAVSLINFTIGAGQQLDATFTMTAPSTPGTYNFQWQIYQDFGVEFFGQTSTNVAIQVGAASSDNAGFVSQTVPASMVGGVTYPASVTMTNSGTTTWAAGSYYVGSQNPQGNSTWGLNRVNLASPTAPGSPATFTFNVLAPSSPGTYNFQWRMAKDGPGHFGNSSTNVAVNVTAAPTRKAAFDLDGDGTSDISFYRAGVWGALKSSQAFSLASAQFFSWGGAGIAPIIADFDGDGKADLAYIVPASGGQSAAYAILKSSTNYDFPQAQFVPAGWPSLGDTPVVGDFDGDGKADPGIWRSSNGVWIIPTSSSNYTSYIFLQWGQAGDTPIVGDFDGDGKSDIGFYRAGLSGVLKSAQSFSLGSAQFFSWGGAGLSPIVADFDGDGKADLAYVVPPSGAQSSAYAILKSSTNYDFTQAQFVPAGWPSLGDTPAVGDFDGDGKADPGTWRSSNGVWIIPKSSSGFASYIFLQWGQAGDTRVPNNLSQN